MSAFAEVTAVRRRLDSDAARPAYDVDLDLGWSIAGKPNGGYLMAVVANAALDAVGRAHPLAVSGHFLRPPDGGPAEVRVDVVKRGRTASTARTTLWQNDKPCLDMLVTAGELPGGDADYLGAPRPEIPAPDDCRARSETDFRVELLDHVDVRIDPATVPFHGNHGEPVIRGWMRFRDGSDADANALLLAVDVCPPTVFRLGLMGWAPTVELTCLLRGEPAPGWLAFEAKATLVSGGWFDEEATVWDSAGHLVAQSRQLALVGKR
jgi:acyl-CoA thioesterase